MKCTELSKSIWNLKNQGITPKVKWGVKQKVKSKVSPNYCKLCLTENFLIFKSLDDCNLLNKSKCRYQNKLVNAGIKISCYYAM